jgi:hypothetical protein
MTLLDEGHQPTSVSRKLNIAKCEAVVYAKFDVLNFEHFCPLAVRIELVSIPSLTAYVRPRNRIVNIVRLNGAILLTI